MKKLFLAEDIHNNSRNNDISQCIWDSGFQYFPFFALLISGRGGNGDTLRGNNFSSRSTYCISG